MSDESDRELRERLALLPPADHPWWTPRRREALRLLAEEGDIAAGDVEAYTRETLEAFVALDLVEARRPMVELGGRRMVVPSRETTYALLPPEETARRIAAVSRTE